MKKVVVMIITIVLTLAYNLNVSAKDAFKSINKYKEESLEYIIKSYNENEKNDGMICAVTYLKDKNENNNSEYNDTQIILVKYNKEGKKVWTYDYGKTIEDKLFYITYTYKDNKVDGYLLVANETSNIEENKELAPTFIKVGLYGKEETTKSLNLPSNANVNKVITSYNEENAVDGYIIIGEKNTDNKKIGFISKYNLDLDQVWEKDINDDNYQSISVKDIILVKDNTTKFYAAILNYTNENEIKNKLIKFDVDGNEQETIKEDFEEEDTPKLLELDNSYIVYGYTNEVKLKNNKSTSYYMIKYNINNEEEWDTIGNNPINKKEKIQMQKILNEEEQEEYIIMTTSDIDSSIEITRIDNNGLIQNKLKKINNEYYDIKNFLFNNNILYFVGQINCPEDDNCDYDMKSLLLISTEDKVIEVEESDNTLIFIISGTIFIFILALVIYRRQRKNKLT